ncbi:hypothetical protein [Rhizobium sp. Rhizsp82]|uniref:hypothetical protein n=1 Tax=Rhizobium sp. Rhizsp82 TaxID=3243057 RepID=UPI0039B6C171
MAEWTDRAFTVAEAAAMSGLNRAHLDVIVSRARSCDVLFSERRNGRRWFSPKDITVLRLAHEIERAGQTWLTALARAFHHLDQPPPIDAVLMFSTKSVSYRSGRVISGLHGQAPSGSMAVIPIGLMAAEILHYVEQEAA